MNLKEADKMYIGNTFRRYDAVFKKGNGAYLTDVKGRKYIDMLAGVAVNLLGYNDADVNRAAIGQIKKYIHTSNLFYSPYQVKLAELILRNTGGSKVYFANTGAEASEIAFKIARKWGILHKRGAYKVVSMYNSFHGRTIAALAATGQKKFHKYLKPLPPGFIHARFNDIKDAAAKIDSKTAAVFVEPVQAEGGVNIPEKNYLEKLKALCARKNVLLMIDEVQTGLGRTGRFLASAYSGVKPDIITLGKGLGGGFPLSAVVVSKRLEKVFTYGDHGTTMGGNHVACAAGYAAMKKISTEKMLKSVREKGRMLLGGLKNIKSPLIKEARGMGMIVGLELSKPLAGALAAEAFKKRLIINACRENVIRIVPPLIIGKKEIGRAVKIIEEALKGMEG